MNRAVQAARTAVVVGALAALAYGQYWIRLDRNNGWATLALVLGAAVSAAFLRFGQPPPPEEPGEPRCRSTTGRMVAAILMLAGVALAAYGSVLLSTAWRGNFGRGAGLLIGGVAVLSFGLSRCDPQGGRRRWSTAEVIAVAAILALGAFLRFHRFTEFPDPFGVHAVEEPQTGQGGFRILTEGGRPWEFMLDHYLAALALHVAGHPSVVAIRAPFAVFSALTIGPFHLLARQLVGVPAALGGTFLFAVSSWNIIYSRCAHNIFFTNFLVVIVLALLVRFRRTRRLAGLAWAGLLSGYTLYAYAGYRGTTLFVLAFMALAFAADLFRWLRAGGEQARRAVLRGVYAGAIVVTVAAAAAAPIATMVVTNEAHRRYYVEAANRSLANDQYYTADREAFVRQRVERIRQTARIFMHAGDGSWTFNAPGEPMLDPLTATLFMGGLASAALFAWRGVNLFLVLMFLGVLAGGAVFVQNLDVRRLQGATPFVALFAALFLDRLWAECARLPDAIRRGLVVAVAAAGGAFALYWNYEVYFHKMAGHPMVRETFRNRYMTVIRYGHTEGAGREILLLSEVRNFFLPSDYTWLISGVMRGRLLGDVGDVLPPNVLPRGLGPTSVVVQPPMEGAAVAGLLERLYPGTACHQFADQADARMPLTVCDLPPGDVAPEAADFALEGRYWLAQDPEGAPFLTRREPFIGFVTLPAECRGERRQDAGPVCAAEWRGCLKVAEAGNYEFRTVATARSQPEVYVDDEKLDGGLTTLDAGPHRVRMQVRLPRGGDTGARLEWKRNGRFEVVPFYDAGGVSPDCGNPARE